MEGLTRRWECGEVGVFQNAGEAEKGAGAERKRGAGKGAGREGKEAKEQKRKERQERKQREMVPIDKEKEQEEKDAKEWERKRESEWQSLVKEWQRQGEMWRRMWVQRKNEQRGLMQQRGGKHDTRGRMEWRGLEKEEWQRQMEREHRLLIRRQEEEAQRDGPGSIQTQADGLEKDVKEWEEDRKRERLERAYGAASAHEGLRGLPYQ